MVFIILALVTFFLHLIWERSHIPLYRNYDQLKGILPVSVWASLGDVVYTFGAVFFVALFKGTIFWIDSATVRDFVGLGCIGLFTALFVEYKAFHFKRWAYTESMPIVPILDVGVSSLFQKSLLFPFTVWLSVIITTFILHYHSV